MKTVIVRVSGHKSEHVYFINVFHDVIAVLYTLTNIYPKDRILLNAISGSHSVSLALFLLTSTHIIQKSTKTETRKQQDKR